MAGEGRPPTSFLDAAWKDMDGRDKHGHDTWGASVNLFAAWYEAAIQTCATRDRYVAAKCLTHLSRGPPMALSGAGGQDVDGRDKHGHDTWGACVSWCQMKQPAPNRRMSLRGARCGRN